MQFDLFKIMDKRYVDDFRNGYLYMNTVRYFHDNFRDPIIGDVMEGDYLMRNKNTLPKLDPNFLECLAPTVLFEDENYASTHVFCMYSMQVDHKRRWVLSPDKQLRDFCNSSTKEAEMVAVRITNTKHFIAQVSARLRRLVNVGDCDYAEMGHMQYMKNLPFGAGHVSQNGYTKEKKFGYQQEWRIHASFIPKPCGATVLYIGDLHKLTETVSLTNLVDDIGKIYPGYTVASSSVAPLNQHFSFGNMQNIRSCKIPGRAMVFFTG